METNPLVVNKPCCKSRTVVRKIRTPKMIAPIMALKSPTRDSAPNIQSAKKPLMINTMPAKMNFTVVAAS